MPTEETRRVQAARAMVESDLLLGVDALPLGSAPAHADAVPPTALESSVRDSAVPIAVDASAGSLAVAISTDELDGNGPAEVLAALESHHATGCPHCTASTTPRSIVFGEGNPRARVMLVGEAPGAEEDRTGRPFVGKAGELLDRMIAAVGLARGDVYIANVLKTRPPDNRTPRPDEAARCGPWLASQIAVVRPSVIVALGGTPAKHLLGTSTGITRLRGVRADVVVEGTRIPVLPTFHPAYVLRQYTEDVRRAVWEDLKQAVALAGHG